MLHIDCSCLDRSKGHIHHEGLPRTATTIQNSQEGRLLCLDPGRYLHLQALRCTESDASLKSETIKSQNRPSSRLPRVTELEVQHNISMMAKVFNCAANAAPKAARDTCDRGYDKGQQVTFAGCKREKKLHEHLHLIFRHEEYTRKQMTPDPLQAMGIEALLHWLAGSWSIQMF